MIAGLKRALQIVEDLSKYYKEESDIGPYNAAYLEALYQVEEVLQEEVEQEQRLLRQAVEAHFDYFKKHAVRVGDKP